MLSSVAYLCSDRIEDWLNGLGVESKDWQSWHFLPGRSAVSLIESRDTQTEAFNFRSTQIYAVQDITETLKQWCFVLRPKVLSACMQSVHYMRCIIILDLLPLYCMMSFNWQLAIAYKLYWAWAYRMGGAARPGVGAGAGMIRSIDRSIESSNVTWPV